MMFCATIHVPNAAAQGAEKDPARLVAELAAPAFRTRELAEAQLRELRTAAAPALEAGLKSADVEVRSRCLRLLRVVRRTAIDIELDEFIANHVLGKSALFDVWPKFKDIAGDGGEAREIFAACCRSDAELLKLVQSNSGQAVTQIVARCTRMMSRADGMWSAEPLDTLGQISAILFASAAAPSAVDMNTLNHLQNVLTRQEVLSLVKGHPVFSKLVERVLEGQPNDQRTFHQRLYLARTLNLTEVLEKKIRPEVRNQLAQAAKNPEINQLHQIAHLAKQIELNEEIEQILKPVVVKVAEKACKQLDQPDQFFTVFNVLQFLQMHDTMNTLMRPAFQKLLANEKLVEGNSSRVYQLVAAARGLNMDVEVRNALQPAMRKHMLKLVRNPNEQEISRLFYEAQYLGMQDSIENLLRPAAHNVVVATLEKSVEVHTLQRMVGVAQMLGMIETTEKTLKPIVRTQIKVVAERLTANDLWQLNQFYYLAQNLGLNESIEKDIKPRVIALIKQGEQKGLDAQHFDPTFNLATMMKMPEAVPLALQAAGDRSMNAARRARAIQYVGQVGGRADVKRLTMLLDDRTTVGAAAWNQVRINTEIRDVALATMVHLSGQSLVDYGFDYSVHTRADFTAIGYTHMGFSSEQRRSDALGRWQKQQP